MNAVAEIRPQALRQLTGDYSLHDMDRMATAMAGSGFFGFKTPDQALAIMLIAQANGQHPATAAQDYDVIQGKPAKKPQAMLRDFIASGGRVEWHQSDDSTADATFSHPAGGSIRVKWDMNRANKMGFGGKDNYKRQPGVMFRWRCVSEGVRIVFPGATGGLYTPEEVADFDEPKKSKKDAGEPAPTDIGPMSGVAESLDANVRDGLEALADEVENLMGTQGAEVACKYLEDQALAQDEKAYLWKLLPSKTRTAIRKAYDASKKEAV